MLIKMGQKNIILAFYFGIFLIHNFTHVVINNNNNNNNMDMHTNQNQELTLCKA